MIELATNERKYVSYLKPNQYPFDKEKIEIILKRQPFINKPPLAFWGSPIDACYGWKEWCDSNDCDFGHDWSKPIYWHLKENSKILVIDYEMVKDEDTMLKNYLLNAKDYEKMNDIERQLIVSPMFSMTQILDFDKIVADDISAIELKDASIGHMFLNSFEEMFNAWDCESIVVLDKDKIIID